MVLTLGREKLFEMNKLKGCFREGLRAGGAVELIRLYSFLAAENHNVFSFVYSFVCFMRRIVLIIS